MIFVSVGTNEYQFNRLLLIIDSLCEKGFLDGSNIIAQIGYSDYMPMHYKYFKFETRDNILKLIQNCDFAIVHSGVGTIVQLIKADKKVVVFPRSKKYKEHVDDHQLEIANFLEEEKMVLEAHNEEEMIKCIKALTDFVPQKNKISKNNISSIIDKYINNIGRKK